ncbi:hypothetical protein ACLG6S_03150 [Thermodesulfobacteriota bacterium B35]
MATIITGEAQDRDVSSLSDFEKMKERFPGRKAFHLSKFEMLNSGLSGQDLLARA